MTPKEKALELVDNFKLNVLDYEGSGLNLFKSKQCALIAVDEIIKSFPHTYDIEKEYTESGTEIITIKNIKINNFYWQQVKQEIQNL